VKKKNSFREGKEGQREAGAGGSLFNAPSTAAAMNEVDAERERVNARRMRRGRRT
jgi:hypothetical protein